MVDLVALRKLNATRWLKAHLTRDFNSTARRLVEPSAKERYLTVSRRTGVPWFFIAVVHQREASQRFDTQLGQGDPLEKVSVHVPIGRGPFRSWEDGAVDALMNCQPFAALNKDWSIGGLLTMLERYNGLGYATRGLPSPYVWAGTDQYSKGKFTRDGFFDPTVIDQQPGCAGMLITMEKLDSSVSFGAPAPTPAPPAPLPPSIARPAPGSIGAFVANLFSRIFRRGS